MNLYIISTLFSGEHLILIIAAIVFLFGGKKIPELMGGIGKGMKEFKKSMKEDDDSPEAKQVVATGVKDSATELKA